MKQRGWQSLLLEVVKVALTKSPFVFLSDARQCNSFEHSLASLVRLRVVSTATLLVGGTDIGGCSPRCKEAYISLFFRAASSLNVVSNEGDQNDVLSLPLADDLRTPGSGNTKSFTKLIRPAVNSGKRASVITAIFAGREMVSSALPAFIAPIICEAARSARSK